MVVLTARDARLWIGGNCNLAMYDGKKFRSYKETDGLRNICV